MTEDAPPLDIDLLAAALRADASELHSFVEALAAKLEEALPNGVQVLRWRERLFGPKHVRKIVVDTGDERLELRVQGARIETFCSRVSGGIVLKTEAVDIDTWLQRLSGELAAQARRSQTTRQALDRLLKG